MSYRMMHVLQALQALFQTSLTEFEIRDKIFLIFFFSEVLGHKQPYLLK